MESESESQVRPMSGTPPGARSGVPCWGLGPLGAGEKLAKPADAGRDASSVVSRWTLAGYGGRGMGS